MSTTRCGDSWLTRPGSATHEAEVSLNAPGLSRRERLTAYNDVSTSLALCSDRALSKLVDAAVPAGSGIGGKSARLQIDGTQVFVKRIPLTDLERLPENARSTANLFGLPVFCQYGKDAIGSGGQRPTGIPPGAAAIIARHAPAAAVMSDFNRTLQGQSRQAPYPLEEIRRALA